MKTPITLILSVALLSAAFAEEEAETPLTNAVPAAVQTAEPATVPSLVPLKEGELRLNLRNAPIDVVLSYLSEAAGFIIDVQTKVKGTVDVFSATPVTKEEAVDILNSMLNKNGYAAIRNGRKLTIVSKTDAVHRDIPVRTGNDPEAVPKTDEIITQIIPIRSVEAPQLVKDLTPLVSPQAMIVANEAGNSIAVTDTQANIHHLMEVIKAIDSSAEDIAEVRVFHLKHHDPSEVATLLTDLFSEQGTSANAANMQMPFRFGGFGGFGAGRGGGGSSAPAPATGGNPQNNRIKKRNRVVAIADPRTSSVVVTASKDIIEQIDGMIEQLDKESPKVAKVSVIHLENADPQQVQQVLQDMFQSSNARSSSTQNSPLMNRIQQNNNTTTSGTTLGGSGSGLGSSRNGTAAPGF